MERDPALAIAHTVVFILIWLLAVSLMVQGLGWIGGELVKLTVAPFAASVLATFTCWKIFHEMPLPKFGVSPDRQGARDLAMGITAGVLGAAVTLAPAILVHVARLTPARDNVHGTFGTAVFVSTLIFCGAAGEELLFRGFAFQSLMKALGPFATILPAGALFGVMHIWNPFATWLSTVNTVGFGIVFGYAVYKTSGLWLPIGMHFGWNVALPFFGVKVSGITMRVTGYEMTWNANPIWSGEPYGPEASLLTTGVLVLIALFVWRYPFPRPAVQWSEPVEGEPAV